jgi:hypothetical protein
MVNNETGSLIHGTHRPQDLIPAFLEEVRNRDPGHYEGFMATPFGPIPAHAMEDEDAEWWMSEDAAYLLEELFDILDEAAPEGYRFGAHEGDGSDFGYWPIED